MGLSADELASDCPSIGLTPELNSVTEASHKKDRNIRSFMA